MRRKKTFWLSRLKKFKLEHVLLLAGVILLTLHACKKDEEECCDPTNPNCGNYDPCFGETEVSADFQFLARYGIGNDAEWIPETKFIGSPIRFSAIDKQADSYTWYLGLDTITGQDEVELEINNLDTGSYSAILVLEKEPNLNCYPQDDGRDSLIQFFERIDFCDALYLGKFRGISPTVSSDSIDIEIQWANMFTGEICDDLSMPRLINVLGNNDTIFTQGGYSVYSRNFFGGDGSGTLRGEINVDEIDLSTYFSYRLDNIDYQFRGRKLE